MSTNQNRSRMLELADYILSNPEDNTMEAIELAEHIKDLLLDTSTSEG